MKYPSRKWLKVEKVTSTSDTDNLPKIVSLHEFSLSLKTFQAISYSTYCRYFHIVTCRQFILKFFHPMQQS